MGYVISKKAASHIIKNLKHGNGVFIASNEHVLEYYFMFYKDSGYSVKKQWKDSDNQTHSTYNRVGYDEFIGKFNSALDHTVYIEFRKYCYTLKNKGK